MAHNDTQYAWYIHTGEPVHIGDRKDWTSQGTDKQGRPVWEPKDPGTVPKKADRGRSHYCCQEKHISMIVVQGKVNAWCFRPNMLVGVAGNPCGLQEMIREFQSLGEGERHKKAKHILANFLNSDTGKAEFFIQEVIVEEKIPELSLEVIPDIRLKHSDGRPDSYVEIVDTSTPHQNPNSWNFYKGKLTQLIVIDIKDNERGWHYDKAGIHKLLVDRFRNRFDDHINTPKIWDDVSAALTRYEKLRREQHIKDADKSKEIEEEKSPRRRELSKRENELLQLTKQHMAIRAPHGMTAFEYGLLGGPKGGGDNVPLSGFTLLSNHPKERLVMSIEKVLVERIAADLIEHGLAEWVCRICMGHHKTYSDCPNTKCDYTTWLENQERRIKWDQWRNEDKSYTTVQDRISRREESKRISHKLKELKEMEALNPSITEFCSLCSVLLQENSVQNNGVVKVGEFPTFPWKSEDRKRIELFNQIRNALPENMSVELKRHNRGIRILYAEPLTKGQVEAFISNVWKHVDVIDSNLDAVLGFTGRDSITPSEFYSTISPEIVCPKCVRRPANPERPNPIGDVGGRKELSYTPDCDCDQGKVASDCETCEGGTIRPDVVSLHLKLNCDCSIEPACTGHRWSLRLLVTPTNDDPKQLSIICACCGFKVFGDDYIVGDRIRDFWICRSANRMLTDSEYNELLYARHGCVLEDWYSPNAWRDYIDG